jgi:hypothetical protein
MSNTRRNILWAYFALAAMALAVNLFRLTMLALD